MRFVTAAGMIVLTLAGPRVGAPLAQRVIEQDIWIPSAPLTHCAVPELAGRVFDAVTTVGGIEYLPGRCADSGRVQPPAMNGRVTMRGLSAREALDRLVEADPRFRWAEVDGVMVIRPVDAWTDLVHFLNHTVSVSFTNQNVGGALFALLNAIGPGKFQGDRQYTFTTDESKRLFSVSSTGSSAFAALNAVVRAHGSLKWGVSYCRPERRVEFARVFLHTFDGAGMAGQPDESATDACQDSLATDRESR